MQMKTLVALAFATLAAATPTPRNAPSSGEVCCNSLTSASDPAAALLLGLLGVVVQDVNAVVGLTCTSVTVIGNSATCGNSQTLVSCQDNSHHNLISVGCVPVTARRNAAPPPPEDKCCSQVVAAKDPSASLILGLLGIVVQDVNALVGLDCTSVTVIGNSATCGDSTTKVTCTDNSHGNLISIGCVPVTLRRRNATPPPPANAKCCSQVLAAKNPSAAAILGLLGIVVQDVNALVGLDCTSVTVIGNSATCGDSTTAVTCTDNSHGNLISIGCLPITL